MKRLGIKTAVMVLMLVLIGGLAHSGNVMSVLADKSPALRVYNGATGTVTAVVSTNGDCVKITVDGNETVIIGGTSYDTISELAAGIAACTNAAGERKLTVDSDCSLAADSTDDELLDGTYTATAGNWLEMLWDTSECKFYNVYLPSRTYRSVGAYIIGKIFGEPTGTGDVTLSIYKAGSIISRKIITSPYYVLTATNTVNAEIATINLNEDVGLRVTGGQALIIRAARGTTATTGMISVSIED